MKRSTLILLIAALICLVIKFIVGMVDLVRWVTFSEPRSVDSFGFGMTNYFAVAGIVFLFFAWLSSRKVS